MDSDGKRELMKTWSEPQTPWGSLGFWQQVFRKPSWSRGRNLTSVMDWGVLQRSEKARKSHYCLLLGAVYKSFYLVFFWYDPGWKIAAVPFEGNNCWPTFVSFVIHTWNWSRFTFHARDQHLTPKLPLNPCGPITTVFRKDTQCPVETIFPRNLSLLINKISNVLEFGV